MLNFQHSMYFSVILLVLIVQNIQAISTITPAFHGGNNQGHPPGNAANQNLDPNDVSPGSLVLPDGFERYKIALPKIEKTDPDDDQLNVHEFHYRNNPDYFLWHKPPCEWYQEHLGSAKNERRRVGCYHIYERLVKDMKKEKKHGAKASTNCDGAFDGECFQFRGRRGRCYMKVKTGPGTYDLKYVLVNNCD